MGVDRPDRTYPTKREEEDHRLKKWDGMGWDLFFRSQEGTGMSMLLSKMDYNPFISRL